MAAISKIRGALSKVKVKFNSSNQVVAAQVLTVQLLSLFYKRCFTLIQYLIRGNPIKNEELQIIVNEKSKIGVHCIGNFSERFEFFQNKDLK